MNKKNTLFTILFMLLACNISFGSQQAKILGFKQNRYNTPIHNFAKDSIKKIPLLRIIPVEKFDEIITKKTAKLNLIEETLNQNFYNKTQKLYDKLSEKEIDRSLAAIYEPTVKLAIEQELQTNPYNNFSYKKINVRTLFEILKDKENITCDPKKINSLGARYFAAYAKDSFQSDPSKIKALEHIKKKRLDEISKLTGGNKINIFYRTTTLVPFHHMDDKLKFIELSIENSEVYQLYALAHEQIHAVYNHSIFNVKKNKILNEKELFDIRKAEEHQACFLPFLLAAKKIADDKSCKAYELIFDEGCSYLRFYKIIFDLLRFYNQRFDPLNEYLWYPSHIEHICFNKKIKNLAYDILYLKKIKENLKPKDKFIYIPIKKI